MEIAMLSITISIWLPSYIYNGHTNVMLTNVPISMQKLNQICLEMLEKMPKLCIHAGP